MDPVCEFVSLLNFNRANNLVYDCNVTKLLLYKHITKSFYDYTVFFESLKNKQCTCNNNCANFYLLYKEKSFEDNVSDYENLKSEIIISNERLSFDEEYLNTIIATIENIKTDEDLYLLDYNISDLYKKYSEIAKAKELVWDGILQCRIQNNIKGIVAGKLKLEQILQ